MNSSILVGVRIDDINAHTLALGEGGDNCSQRLRGTTAATDHTTEIVRVNTHLEHIAACGFTRGDTHPVSVIDDPSHQMVEGLSQRLVSQGN